MTVYEVLTVALVIVLGVATTAAIYLDCSTGSALCSSSGVRHVTI